MSTPAAHPRPTRRAGFTFIELMISIALVVVLMLGVNQVFSYTSRAVGSGEAVNAAIRDSRSTGETLAADFRAMVANGTKSTDAPFMVLTSRNVYAWRNALDQSSSRTGTVSLIDLNGNGTEGDATVAGEVVSPATTNFRNHRIDVFSFFARDPFHRQTGNSGTFVADQSATEAWVWYGHLALPDNTYDTAAITSNQYPGSGTASSNPNNFYASQFTLGRVAMLLANASPPADDNGTAQMYVDGSSANYPYAIPMGPLNRNAPVNFSTAPAAGEAGTYQLPDARVDVGNASIAGLQSNYAAYVAPYRITGYGFGAGNASVVAGAQLRFNNNPVTGTNYPFGTGVPWWDYLADGANPPDRSTGVFTLTRFKCNPFVTKPMSARDMAQATPFLTRGVSQFSVEYAGDYLNQENNPAAVAGNPTGDLLTNNNLPGYTGGNHQYQYNYGDVTGCWMDPLYPAATVTGTGTDGQVDYVLIQPANSVLANGVARVTLPGGGTVDVPRSQWQKQIRWYGFPRSTSNHAAIDPIKYGDVVPLAWHLKHAFNTSYHNPLDVTRSITAGGVAEMSFEKFRSGDTGDVLATGNDRADGNYAATLTAGTPYDYVCAWGPTDPKPKLIRITMTLEDPTGRLPDGQTFQYVFQVP